MFLIVSIVRLSLNVSHVIRSKERFHKSKLMKVNKETKVRFVGLKIRKYHLNLSGLFV